MGYKLGARSLGNLEGVHPELVAVVERAIEITERDFTVVEGVRSYSRQLRLYKSGASKTMKSRHLNTYGNGLAHAVDIMPYPFHGDYDGDGKPNIEDWDEYYLIEVAMKQAAKELGIPLEWGGDWKSFKDGPHWQLPWSTHNGKD